MKETEKRTDFYYIAIMHNTNQKNEKNKGMTKNNKNHTIVKGNQNRRIFMKTASNTTVQLMNHCHTKKKNADQKKKRNEQRTPQTLLDMQEP
jgi:hypothetical protein